MDLFIYLKFPEHITTWVDGGTLPLKTVKDYLSKERDAEMTPDEGSNRSFTGSKSFEDFDRIRRKFVDFKEVDNISDIRGNIVISGNIMTTNGEIELDGTEYFSNETIDGLILCFSKTKSKGIAKRFCRDYCVQIIDFPLLKKSIDDQLGKKGCCDSCRYTTGPNRSHFLKSIHDKWQNEFRIVWSGIEKCSVELPKGVAKHVKI